MDPELRQSQFAELVALHHAQLFGYLFTLVHNLHDAEDLYQRTCLVLWEKFDEFELGTNFFRWARVTAEYQALNYLRRRKRQQAVFSAEFQAEMAEIWAEPEGAAWRGRAETLEQCVEKLPPRDRQLLEQCYGLNQSIRAAAETLGRSPKSVYDALGRIRRALQRCVERRLAGEER